MKYLIVVVVVAVFAAALYFFLRTRGTRLTEPVRESYVRQESEAEKAFYEPYAEFSDLTSPEMDAFLKKIEAITLLPRHGESYPTDLDTVRKMATAFATAASSEFDFELSVGSDNADQLDEFANTFLIDPSLREFFEGNRAQEELSDSESARFAEIFDAAQIPNEPLLYYAMGCFWGEWLVAHRQATWTLLEPLRPIQSFPDMISTASTICMHPFSQVTKKLSDPIGDNLAFKATVSTRMKRQFPPYPLIAAIADANIVEESRWPPEFLKGWRLADAGDHKGAFEVFDSILEPTTENPELFFLAIPSAWEAREWKVVERWSLRALELSPRHPVLNHNLAVLYSNIPDALSDAISMLRIAIEEDPSYGRARLTLASCLSESGEPLEASEQLEWVAQNDHQLREEAESLLKEIHLKLDAGADPNELN